MNQDEKIKVLTNYLTNFYHNGTIIKLSWKSTFYNAKGHMVTKYTEGYKRLGVEYENIKIVDSKHQGLKGEQNWINRYMIKNNKTNEVKLRVSHLQNMDNFKSKVYYLDENGRQYNKPEEIDFLPESKKHPNYSQQPVTVFDIKLNNLLSVGDLNF